MPRTQPDQLRAEESAEPGRERLEALSLYLAPSVLSVLHGLYADVRGEVDDVGQYHLVIDCPFASEQSVVELFVRMRSRQ